MSEVWKMGEGWIACSSQEEGVGREGLEMVDKWASSESNGMTNSLCSRGRTRSGLLSGGERGAEGNSQVSVKARRRRVKRLRI